MTTLISFLGKGRRDASTNRYQEVTYQLDGRRWPATAYFGQALARQLAGVRRLVVLGTSSSIWDVLGADLTIEDEDRFDQLAALQLGPAVQQDRVTQPMLDALGPLLGARLGIEVCPILTGFARTAPEQARLLEVVGQQVAEGDHVVLDVTHGFRHLPMLALVAARYLAHVRAARIDGIYYGALEMRGADGVVPVLDLSGLLTMLDWVDALSSYRKDGDYSTFADLLVAGGMSPNQADELRRAAFHERANSSELARPRLSTATAAIDALPDPLTQLFKGELKKRMDWSRKPDRATRELALADAYFSRKDYLRGVLYLFEGLITAETMRAKADHNDYAERDAAKDRLRKHKREFGELDRLRNALAHGLRSDDSQVNRSLASEEALQDALRRLSSALR